MRGAQVRRNEKNARISRETCRTAQKREIRGFGNRHRELCAQDFLGPEALRCYEKSSKRMQ